VEKVEGLTNRRFVAADGWENAGDGRSAVWRPRFLISVISTNGRISRVKPADSGQT
jgi:hypothetical protein